MIRVVTGALADAGTEAVVRPIRTDLAPVSSASRDVAVAAGPAVEKRLERLGTLPLGSAVMMPGGDLPADFIIHAAVMSEEEPPTIPVVQKALRNGLHHAVDWEIRSVAVPPLGMGAGLTDPESWARGLVETLRVHLDEGKDPLDLVIVVSTSYEQELFARLVEDAKRERGA